MGKTFYRRDKNRRNHKRKHGHATQVYNMDRRRWKDARYAERPSPWLEDEPEYKSDTGFDPLKYVAHNCRDKRVYRTEYNARRAAEDSTRKHGEQFYAYACPACGFYHLTTHPWSPEDTRMKGTGRYDSHQ